MVLKALTILIVFIPRGKDHRLYGTSLDPYSFSGFYRKKKQNSGKMVTDS